jgi:hypothetical protein
MILMEISGTHVTTLDFQIVTLQAFMSGLFSVCSVLRLQYYPERLSTRVVQAHGSEELKLFLLWNSALDVG